MRREEGGENHMSNEIENPLLPKSSGRVTGTASAAQTLGNIIVSIVGTGVLGLPFAFRVAGWLAGCLGVMIAGLSTYYCMLLLIQCRDKLVSEDTSSTETKTYGDLGYKCMGKAGRFLTEFLIFTSQCGALAPFSIFADICNVLAMTLVVKEDVQKILGGEFSFSDRKAVSSNIRGLPFAGGMAVFCFEGFGMTFALESSMRERGRFSKLLAQAFTGITLVYVTFGFFGFMAYGDDTKDIVTLNLPKDWSSIAVQMGLCVALIFTFPIMVHPVHEIIEGSLKKSSFFQTHPCISYDNNSTTRLGKFMIYISRAILVVALAAIASFIPGFGAFTSLVGSTLCALISFVLPALYHLILLGSSLNFWQRSLDVCILLCGLLFAVNGTYNSIVGV
ncbi:Amino acid transporter ANT1 [Citrus sinensis]|uniref:Amino acid transporter ANT1 n=1 Tax=Citrus sinensis TaxID=2711 RepID=A0ACB8JYT2_CITSI|nr:Amino acid transporter ANT1 [Citrus sinensis]